MNVRTHSKNLDFFPENYLLTQEKQRRGNRSSVGFVSLVGVLKSPFLQMAFWTELASHSFLELYP